MVPEPIHNELHRIACTGIIWRTDGDRRQYLITKRAPHKKVWPNKWTVPGGGLEVTDYINSESSQKNPESPQWYSVLERTLLREIQEEVGVAVDDIKPLQDVAFIRPDGVPVIVLSFFCRYVGGDVVLDADATEFAWIGADEVGNYDFVKGIDEEIQMVEDRLNKN